MTLEKKMILDGDTLREYTDAEYAQNDIDLAEAAAIQAQEDAKAKEAEANRAAAQAKLAALGLTTDDLKALGLGGNE